MSNVIVCTLQFLYYKNFLLAFLILDKFVMRAKQLMRHEFKTEFLLKQHTNFTCIVVCS